MRLLQGTLAAGLLIIVSSAWACADSRGFVGTEPDTDAGVTPEAGDPDAPGFGEAGPGGACGCSADMHSVISCDGKVVQTCPADKACSQQQCIPACDAAAANKSSVGCDYWVHNARFQSGTGCEALFIANAWNAPATLTAEVAGVKIDLSKYTYLSSGTGPSTQYTPIGLGGTVPAGKVGIVFMRDGQFAGYKCPAGVSVVESDPAAAAWTDPWEGTYSTDKAQAIRVFSSVPVGGFDMLPYGGGHGQLTDASLLMPTTSWDNNYVVVTPESDVLRYFSTFSVIAGTDNTVVTVKPTVDLLGNFPLPGVLAGKNQNYTLQKGQVLRLWSSTDAPAGSILSATHPIGVWTESPCINIDGNNCDGAHEQLAPVHALGSEYVYARYRNRVDKQDETPPTVITGLVDGTTLAWDPSPMNAKGAINKGETLIVRSSGPFIVKSQDAAHPFYATTYMTGGVPFGGAGDPDFVGLIPSAQWLKRYVFFTDPTFPETNLVFIRKKDQNGKLNDVTLDCAGVVGNWTPVGSTGNYEFARLDLSRHLYQGQNGCDNGGHEAHSDGPFTITVWGWGTAETGDISAPGWSQFVSYAYPVGGAAQTINNVIVTPN